MGRLRCILLILPLACTACVTTPPEPEPFNAEFISFQAGEIVDSLPDGIPFIVPGYTIKFRSNMLPSNTIKPDRKLYEFVLMDCAKDDYISQSPWISARDRNHDGTAIYTAQLYKDSFDSLDLPNSLCAQILIGNGKRGTRIKRPVLTSNKILLDLPN